jgi:hypothetical protein
VATIPLNQTKRVPLVLHVLAHRSLRTLSHLLRQTRYPLDLNVSLSLFLAATIPFTQAIWVPLGLHVLACRFLRPLSHLLRRSGSPSTLMFVARHSLRHYPTYSDDLGPPRPLCLSLATPYVTIPLTQTSQVPSRPLRFAFAVPCGHYPTYSDEPGTHSILMFVARRSLRSLSHLIRQTRSPSTLTFLSRRSLRPLSHLLIKNNAATFYFRKGVY